MNKMLAIVFSDETAAYEGVHALSAPDLKVARDGSIGRQRAGRLPA